MTRPVRIARIDAWACRCPIEKPVATSFGTMHDRPAVFVRIEDDEGAFGWGEIWANWPAAGAEHRVNLLAMDIAPLVLGRAFEAPDALFRALEDETRIRAVQCGEQGPFANVIAGLDTALWDLFARRAGLPLRRMIRADAGDAVPVYASGIQIAAANDLMPAARAAGYRHFKLKVGFDRDADIAGILALRGGSRPGETLAADANQAWDVAAALHFIDGIGDTALEWLEEPLPVFAPDAAWATLRSRSPIPLAGGENLTGLPAFASAIAAGSLHTIQPDVAKWGGVTGCLDVARAALAAGRRYCPHFLGGGIGLVASAELLAGAGGDGRLEVDVNRNPLRTAFFGAAEPVEDGAWSCHDAPGLGIDAVPDALLAFATLHREMRR